VGIRETLLRPIYLVSKTPYLGIPHIPILSTHFFTPEIDFTLYDGIIITSKQTVHALRHYTIDWKRLQCVCVSEQTAQAASQAGAINIEIGNGYGTSIPEILSAHTGKWLYLRPYVVASDWVQNAKEQGILVDEVVMYETTCNEAIGDIDIAEDGVLIFTSPSAVRCFMRKKPLLCTHSIIAIGTTTQNALPLGIQSVLSETTSVQSCVEKAQELSFLRL
jgi:uroporphyrinogen-III synthase